VVKAEKVTELRAFTVPNLAENALYFLRPLYIYSLHLKGKSHEIDQAYFKSISRSLHNYEPRAVLKIFNFAYYFIFNLKLFLPYYKTLAYLQFPSYSAGKHVPRLTIQLSMFCNFE